MHKYYLIVNPHGGGGKGLEIKNRILPVFNDAGAELTIIETTHPHHAEELAQTLDLAGYTGFCPIGGDGTMHEVINGMLNREDKQKIPIGLITGGSGNSFMHDLELLDPIEAAKTVVQGKIQPIDITDLQMGEDQLYIFNIIGWGLVTDAGIKAEYIRWMGQSRYTVTAALEVLIKKRRPAKLTINNQVIDDDFLFVIACNTKHTGKGMKMAPKAELNDGLIDIIVVRDATRLALFNLLPKVFDGSHVDHPNLEYFQANEFSMDSDNNDLLNLDGEIGGSTPFKAKVIPGALEVFMP